MTPEQIERVFGRGRLKMTTGEHVEVFREAVSPSERRRYTKRFLATDEADFRLWTEREWRILARLIGHGILCVPDVVQFDAGGRGGMRRVQTYDAGITVDQWATLLPVSRDGIGYRSVFEDCGHWWALAHHCLAALSEIHGLQLVHLDIKGDNICVPYGPPHFDPQSSEATLYPAFARLALIDFAFSLVSGEKLGTPLPIGWQKDYDYQSPRLLAALEAGRRGDLGPTEALDWRCDLYSLAAMLKRYLPGDDCIRERFETGWTQTRYADARELIYRLRECHDRELPSVRPHQELMDITGLRVRESDLADSLARGWTLARDATPRGGATPITPLTRVTATTRLAGSEPGAAQPIASTAVTAVATAVVRRRRARAPVAVVRRRGAGLRVTPTLGEPHASSAPEPVVASPLRNDEAPISRTRARAARRRGGATATMICALAALAAPSYLGRVAVESSPTTAAASTVPHRPESGGTSAAVPEPSPRLSNALAEDRIQSPSEAAGVVRSDPGGDEGIAAGVSSIQQAHGNAVPRAAGGESPAASAPTRTPGEPRARIVASKQARAARQNVSAHASTERTVTAHASSKEPGMTSKSTSSWRGGRLPPIHIAEASASAKPSATSGHPSSAHIAHASATHEAETSTATPREPMPVQTAAPASGADKDSAQWQPNVASVAPAPNDGRGEPSPESAAPVDVASAPGNTSHRDARGAPRPAGKPNTDARHPWRLADLLDVFAFRQQRAAPVEERSMSSANGARTRSSGTAPRSALALAAPGSVGASPARRTAEPALEPSVVTAPMTATTAAVPHPPMPQATPPEADVARANSTKEQETSTSVTLDAAAMQRALHLDAASITIDAPSGMRADSAVAPSGLQAREAAGAIAQTPDERVDPIVVPPRSIVRAPNSPEGVDRVPAVDKRLMAERVRRLAAAAYVDARPVLRIASLAYAPSADRALIDAVQATWPSQEASAPAPTFATERARRLHSAARRAFAYGARVEDVIDVETDAFAANPRDADIAGFLAFLHLQTLPRRPDTARELALHALASSGAQRTARVDDWDTFAIASALSGRQSDATAAFLVEAALASDLERGCRSARRAYERYGLPLRSSVEAMLYRVQADPRARRYPACALLTY